MSAQSLRTTLFGKLSVLIAVLILATAVALSAMVVTDQKKKIYGEMIQDGTALTELIARNTHYGIYTEDSRSLEELLSTLNVNPDIDFAAVLSADEKVLGEVRFHPDGLDSRPFPVLPIPTAEGSGTGSRAVFVDRGDRIEIIVPVFRNSTPILADPLLVREPTGDEELLGYTQVVMSKKGISRRVNSLLKKTVYSTLAVIVFAVLATLFMTRRIVRPLNQLHEAVVGIAEDAPVGPLAVTSSDEIGGLSRAFNRMLSSLQKSRAKVAERTEALERARDEMAKQNEELKRLDRMKNAFIDAVSHEMKTPVAKHAMQIELLRPALAKNPLGAMERQALSVMEQSIRRQQATIRNLLDLSRLEAGRVAYKNEKVRLGDLLAEVLEDYRYATESYGFDVQVAAGMPTITTDRGMLWHVFSNIINNAIKFRAPDVPPRLSITWEEREGAVQVRFEDNGLGLAADEQQEVFSAFFQASASIEGSGVGLNICKKIIEGLKGRIWMESPGKGKGATAFVSLPLG